MGATDISLAVAQDDPLVGDSLVTRGVPERVNYATGVLLGADDFAAEQLYLRARLARALAALYGYGTLAGLRVSCNTHDNPELEVQVAPGLALDRLGRLIEIRRIQCVHVARWLAQRQSLAADALERVNLTDAVRQDVPGQKRLVLDVFVHFVQCAHGATPAFAAGPFNATDYVVPSRLADGFELSLQPAHTINITSANPKGVLALPQSRSPKLEGMLADMQGITDAARLEAARRQWCVESALDAWPEASQLDPGRLPKLAEQASDADWNKLLLARVSVPVLQADATTFPSIDSATLAALDAQPSPAPTEHPEPRWRDLADNGLRPIVFNPYSWRGAL